MSTMSQATIPITINTFKPMNGNTAAAARGIDVIDFAFGPFSSFSDDGFKISMGGADGKSLIITRETNARGTTVNLNYQLQSTAYVLNGVAFLPINNSIHTRDVFPQFHLNRTSTDSSICVDDVFDSANKANLFTYVILVEEIATGSIGIIDPDIRNEMDN